ncbi:hypothetical protein GCK72_016760 [Caenorhabditis remanei]|uniref:F-box domain-containing protein n=1 Tax=Caenorhabditis remanei TaxID=31234 RepID=A0A6A5G5Y5_CAERE|nr:hypothetical protein GCK72_016760 [Caenorhabditis remanei]KAF1750213.1 hypothetical protein GCK72_016760 [Caenorhabditis remanei]
MKGFPLLCLPNVALQEVLSTMNPLELVFLSKASLKAKRVAKFFSKQKPISQYSIILDFENPSLQIDGTTTKCLYDISNLKYMEGYLNNDDEYYVKYSKNRITALMEFARYVIEVFGWPVRQVQLNFGKFRNKNNSITDFLKIHVKSTDFCILDGDIIADRYASYFFKNVQVTVGIVLLSKMSANFRLILPQHIHYLDIQESDYITYDQINNFNFDVLKLCKTKITNQELNLFFKNWMASKSHINLRSFLISIENLEAFDTIADLPDVIKGDPKTVRILHREQVVGGCDIKRNDGTVATLYTKSGEDGNVDLILIVH